MREFNFDATLTGADGSVFPVYCEVQPPCVGGQKSLIRIAVPAKNMTKNVPRYPCILSGGNDQFTINMQGVSWRQFPNSSSSTLGLEAIELRNVKRLTVQRSSESERREIRFHIAPISYLRSESSCVLFGGDKSCSADLFMLNLPGIGMTRFVAEWRTIYHRDAEIPGATVIAGFSAVADLPANGSNNIDLIVEKFKNSLEVLSVLFRQAVSLHGWTRIGDQTVVSTWIDSLEPNVAPSAYKDLGDFVTLPEFFKRDAESLTLAYEKADEETKLVVQRLLTAVNPHINLTTDFRFLSMFSALEKVTEFAKKRDKTPQSPATTDSEMTVLLEQLKQTVIENGGENASEISNRLSGFIKAVKNGTSFQDKFSAFLRMYPMMKHYCGDLWPIQGSDKKRGLKEIRNALTHGGSSSVTPDVVAVAEWHLAILLERMIFVLLEIPVPAGISPNSFLLRIGGRGWYDRDWWEPLQLTVILRKNRHDQSI